MLIMYYILCDVKQNFEKILRGLLGGSAGGCEAGDDGDCEHKEEGNRGKPMPPVGGLDVGDFDEDGSDGKGLDEHFDFS